MGILSQQADFSDLDLPKGAGDPAASRRGFIQYSGYDATKPKGRRVAPTGLVRDEDRELPPSARRALVSAQRDIHRNFAIAAWAIRKHLDYTTTFRFSATTGDEAMDAAVNEFIKKAGRKENYDIAGRHSLRRYMRIAEARSLVDGDIFELKLSDGRVQWIEGDRIRTPYAGLSDTGVDPATVNHGVVLGPGGRAAGYILCRRAKTNDLGMTGQDMQFERVLKAGWVYHHASWELNRVDQVRGISPLAAAYNGFRDVYEGVDYALVKAKAAQLFAMLITRKAAAEEGNVDALGSGYESGEEGCEDQADEASPYEGIDLNHGPIKLEMEPGDDAKFLESQTPSTEFQNFIPLVIQMTMKALDIPYSFYDESWTNYSGQKQGWVLYEKSATVKRQNVRDMLHDWTDWRLGVAIDDGELVLSKGMTRADLKYNWQHAGTPWLDQLKEAVGKIAAIEASLESPIEVIEETTDRNWKDVLRDKKKFLEAHDEIGIPRPQWGIDQTAIMQATAPANEDAANDKSGSNLNTKTNRKSVQDVAMAMAVAERAEPEAHHARD